MSYKNWGNSFNKTIPKPVKAGGTYYIGYKHCVMSLVLEKYAYISHLENLA